MKTINKRLPQRTCIACRKTKPKRELIRLVCTIQDGIEVDTTGKKTGRGAYLCREERCWDTGLKGNRLEHNLRTTLNPESRKELLRYARSLFPKEPVQ